MKFRVGACALLICLAGCSSEGANTRFGDLVGSASPSAPSAKQAQNAPAARNPADSIANAPDRGALVSYKNKGVASKQEGAYTWYPIAVSEEHALRAVASGQMTIPSPDGSQVKLRYERHVEHADGNWTWIGRVEGGDQNQEAILTFGEKAVYGSVPQAAGAPVLSLQTRGGVLWAVVTDPSKVVSPNKGTNDVMVPPALALRASLASVAAKAQVTQKAVAAGAPATAANTIDVAIGYTQGFATAQGGQSAAVTRLNFLIEVGNQAFTNSLINGYLRIVNTVQVTYADDTANEAALGQLTGHNGTSSIAVSPALVPIRTARDQYGADLAVLVRKFQTPENDGCGIAWLNGADQTAISPTADDDFGFAVISDGNDTGTDGKSYFCSPETLVHELAHLMGSAHDRDNSKNAQGALQYGRYPYSFGMKTDNTGGNFYTIMAYGDDNQNFYRTFSSPLVARCGPTGNLICGVTDQTDNARSLNQTIPVVAQFRAALVSMRYIRGDVNGDLRADIQWYQQSTGILNVWLMQGSAISGNYIYRASPSCSPRIFGDFNEDAMSDVVLTCQNDNRVYTWLSGSSGYSQTITGNFGGGWELVNSADINGDGTDDFIWRQVVGSSTNINIWYMRSGNVISSSTKTISSVCTVPATGDLNGDGAGDIIFMCSDAGVHAWFGGGFNLTQVKLGSYGTGWKVVGSGDVNTDGRSDLIWHQASSGVVNVWLMNGTNVSSFFQQTMPTDCLPKAVSDYDGDGRSDIVWVCGSDRSVHNWLSSGTAFVRQHVGYYGGDWVIVR